MCSASAPQPQPASTTRSPRLQPQLAADVIHLRDLRLVERRVGRREVRAGVGHRLAEPQRVELVADVVVVMDVLARAGRACCAAGDAATARGGAGTRSAAWLARRRVYSSSIMRRMLPSTLILPALYSSPNCRSGSVHRRSSVRRSAKCAASRPAPAERRDPVAVPELESDGRVAERVQQRADQPRFHRVARIVGDRLRRLVIWLTHRAVAGGGGGVDRPSFAVCTGVLPLNPEPAGIVAGNPQDVLLGGSGKSHHHVP